MFSKIPPPLKIPPPPPPLPLGPQVAPPLQPTHTQISFSISIVQIKREEKKMHREEIERGKREKSEKWCGCETK